MRWRFFCLASCFSFFLRSTLACAFLRAFFTLGFGPPRCAALNAASCLRSARSMACILRLLASSGRLLEWHGAACDYARAAPMQRPTGGAGGGDKKDKKDKKGAEFAGPKRAADLGAHALMLLAPHRQPAVVRQGEVHAREPR